MEVESGDNHGLHHSNSRPLTTNLQWADYCTRFRGEENEICASSISSPVEKQECAVQLVQNIPCEKLNIFLSEDVEPGRGQMQRCTLDWPSFPLRWNEAAIWEPLPSAAITSQQSSLIYPSFQGPEPDPASSGPLPKTAEERLCQERAHKS